MPTGACAQHSAGAHRHVFQKAAYGTAVALPERERRCKPGSTSRSDP